MSDTTDPARIRFVPVTVHKRDIFSETISGHAEGDPGRELVMRRLSGLPRLARPLAWALARREVRGLRAVAGIKGVPELVRVDGEGLLRTWTAGTPLQLARPDDPAWYRDARRLLREMRRRGVTHNDLAKPQNWLMTPDGRAAVIDFQIASTHRWRGRRFRIMAYEDLRHLMKLKRRYARAHLTPAEARIAARRSLPARVWRATGKRAYNFVTRRLMHWSDGEGTQSRLERDGPAVRAALAGRGDVGDVALAVFPLPARGVGVYAFVETDMDMAALRRLVPEARAELVQPVPALPRGPDGAVRDDALELVAMNRLDELQALQAREPALAEALAPILRGRLNVSDRQLRR
ncbi:serine/threonine protein kinase [Rhodobacteraceae bacterium WD3A24]|nr:serine/threonine protein kinase [Rhodobacteraceae bacterium WD3A24]